eukprot:TRINITY_DN44255_c0_g1_i1.p1 TRINITY_DN44255_c0_g1~~TRINITY_DN44255_c0_g1_i1.p1  ORF type:complete len:356 (+),score=69.02 TRINITY_DN44255_c0_g1_i1:145-1212(+)
MSDDGEDYLWQDREIRFDCRRDELALRPGEEQVQRSDTIEDTRGNVGFPGIFIVTTLRVLWYSPKDPRLNLSIGLATLMNVTINSGHTLVLYAHYLSGYQFVFTDLAALPPSAPNHVHRPPDTQSANVHIILPAVRAARLSYEQSRAYRDLRLRTTVRRDKEFLLLPREQVYTKEAAVWNLSGEQGNLGAMVVTNVRVVWYSVVAELLNVSIPYVHLAGVSLLDSKFGRALVLETGPAAGEYVFGFRLSNPQRLEALKQEIAALLALSTRTPVLGVTAGDVLDLLGATGDDPPADDTDPIPDDVGVLDATAHEGVMASYLADPGAPAAERSIVYDRLLGLAVEKSTVPLDKLWRV